ncbi:hypothetical protein Tco_0174393 [Tanacetum coccineum]
MFEDDSYKAHTIHNDLYEALKRSLELDYSNQRLADQEEARKKRRDVPRTPLGSPPSPPPPPPPLAGASGAPGTSGASGSSQLPPPPPPPSMAASASQSMAWTKSDTRFESTDFTAAQELSPTDSLMQDDSILDEQVYLSDDEDSGNDHLPKADSRQDWWKPLPEEERPATPQPAWIILSSNILDFEIWAIQGKASPLSISKIKAASYPDFGLELYGYDYLSEIVLRRADFQEHTMAEKDFKYLYPSDFEDLNLLLLQGHLNHLPGYEFKHDYTIIESPRAVVFPVDNNDQNIMRLNEIYKFSDGTLTRIMKSLDYRVKEFKVKRLNSGSTGTYNALLVDVSVILTTGFFREQNDIVIPFKRTSDDTKELTNKDRNPSRVTSNKLWDNYHGDQYYYGEQYYHGKTIEYYHMVECKSL